MKANSHNKGSSLKSGGKFHFAHARIPMKGPRRTKRMHGRKGGVRA
jgi:hypothetical protein